ncbi:MAG TPA: CHAD domain-containing protein [Rhizomicrobium sp.]|jgi:CHAD domain-containing protein|nr:CHAD domain-containing protein [Rhizomicrobium sp.]
MDDPRLASIHSLARKGLGPAQPVKAHPARISRAMRPEDVFRATLSDCLAQLTANVATLRAGRSVEGLHQLRVALRRLETVLKAFGEEFQQDWLSDLRSRAKILSSRLGPARDLDVFLTELLDAPAEGNENEAFLNLRARMEEMRDRAWKEAGDCVAGADFALFTEDVAGLAHSRLPLARDTKLSRVAKRLLDRQQARALKRGKKARDGDEANLHGLRIALKKLRYTAEFLAPLYPRRKVKHYVRELRGLQEHLGAINDIAHVRATIAKLLRETEAKRPAPGERYAAGLVAGWYRARRPHIAKQALRRWKKFRDVKPFWT